jgi:trehalose-6-phosphate synthase
MSRSITVATIQPRARAGVHGVARRIRLAVCGRINGDYEHDRACTENPVTSIPQLSRDEMVALYHKPAERLMLVTALRDGMNLVARGMWPAASTMTANAHPQ